jgi:hypothetical protein
MSIKNEGYPQNALTSTVLSVQYNFSGKKSKPDKFICSEDKMIEFPEEPNSTHPESVTDLLIESIKKLSVSQQEYLLQAVKDWMSDNREYPRKDCQADVLYSDNNRLAQGMIINISAGGLYLQPDSPFAVGQEITLTFEHPFAKKQIKVNGEIIRSNQKGIGVKFDQTIGNIL